MKTKEINGKIYYHVKDNKYKIPYVRQNGKKANRYYILNKCKLCGKEFMQDLSNYKKFNGNGFCSTKCQYESIKAKEGNKKKKRPNEKNTYILIKKRDHPRADKNGYVPEHIIIMEDHIGRHINKNEHIHHINGIKYDNRIENLYLCKDQKEHNQIHWQINNLLKELLERKIISFKDGKYYVNK